MLKLKLEWLLPSSVWLMVVAALITPNPIGPNTATLTWVTQNETTWVNIWNTNANEMYYAASVSPGITNTVTLSATTGIVFQIQEYKLIDGRLQLITFFNVNPVPAFDAATETPEQSQTPQPSVTPTPTATPIQTDLSRFNIPIVMH